MGKSEFSLQAPAVVELTKKGTTISICGGAGGSTVTVADLEAALAAQGLVSPNDAANAPKIVSIYGTTAPKGRLTRDQLTDADVVATGEFVTYTDEGGDIQYVHGGEKAGEAACLIDSDCDKVPDQVVAPTIQWEIPENACTVFEVDYA